MTSSYDRAFLSGPPRPLVLVRPQPNADPFMLYRRLAKPDRPSFLLESGNGSHTTARYSFFGSDPYLTLTGRGLHYQMDCGGLVRTYKGSGLEALRQTLADSIIARPDGLPPFFGGALGYLSYDLVRSFESLPALAADDLALPDLQMAFLDIVAAVDHQTRLLYLMFCPPLSRFQSEPREKLYREGCDRLSELEARLTSPLPDSAPSCWSASAPLVPSQSRETYTASCPAM